MLILDIAFGILLACAVLYVIVHPGVVVIGVLVVIAIALVALVLWPTLWILAKLMRVIGSVWAWFDHQKAITDETRAGLPTYPPNGVMAAVSRTYNVFMYGLVGIATIGLVLALIPLALWLGLGIRWGW